MSRRERQIREKEFRKRLILKSALKIFAKNGYHKASMDSIAEHSELGKSTIYYYYKNKEELLLAVLEEGLKLFFQNLENEWAKIEAVKEKIAAISFVSANFFYDNPDYFKLYLYFSAHPKYNKKTMELLLPVIRSKNKTIIKLFQQAQKEGVIKSINVNAIAEIFGTMVMGVGIFGRYKRKQDLRRRMKLINEILFEGILTNEARRENEKIY